MSSPGSISSSPFVQHLQPALQNHADFGKKTEWIHLFFVQLRLEQPRFDQPGLIPKALKIEQDLIN